MKILSVFFLALISFVCHAQIRFSTGTLGLVISDRGTITSVSDRIHQAEYLAEGQPAPLMQIRVKGVWESAVSAKMTRRYRIQETGYGIQDSGYLVLGFDRDVEVYIRVVQNNDYLKLELTELTPVGLVDAVVWGPVPLNISGTIREIIGAVGNNDFTIGLQVLNVKTLGGFPLNDEGYDPSRSNTAKKTDFGSVLQAFSLDRSRPRAINVWGEQFPRMPVPPVPGETVASSAIALFGCPTKETLEMIGRIEKAENLPHPEINGTWAKISGQTGRSYLIADYSESTIDELLGFTKQAGLMTLYHMNAWKSWGHYELDTTFFPHGTDGFKACLAKAKSMGIKLGAHTLTDFINTNDPYITPIPDPRLAVTGYGKLSKYITETDNQIVVDSPGFFNNKKANWLHTVRIDDELIQYDSVTGTAPFTLTGCKRGAFGTRVSAHMEGAKVGKLLDHPYLVFFPNLDLMKEIAANLARRFNETGLEQMDFDGHEGCLSAGQGDYGPRAFAKIFYDNLDHYVFNGTSNSEPFYWHINSYCNWGEPWNGGFTQSMQQYRLDNQGLLERNYLPNMLGWYLLTDSTTLAEMEWMLARSAGYNAGFAMATSLKALRDNPHTPQLLDAIREWENCRRSGFFSAETREALKDPKKEFHLEKVSDTSWELQPVLR